MTTIAVTHCLRLQRKVAAGPRRPSLSHPSPKLRAVNRSTHVITLTGRPGWIENGQVALPASPPGVIGGAVLRAARRSAGLSGRNLARTLRVSPCSLRAWEEGACALFCMPYGQLCQIADTLSNVGARVGRDVHELLLASQCDLLIVGMLHGFEDIGEVPPIEDDAEGIAARELIHWALTGTVARPYRGYMVAGLLLSKSDVALFTTAARDLESGSRGALLAGYGGALVALAVP